MAKVLDSQAAHGGHTSEGGYGQLDTQGGGQLRSMQEWYEQVSRGWMQWFRERKPRPAAISDTVAITPVTVTVLGVPPTSAVPGVPGEVVKTCFP